MRRRFLRSVYHIVSAVIDPRRLLLGAAAYPRYVVELARFAARARRARLPYPVELHPVLDDRTRSTGFDAHYAYLAYWATKSVLARRPQGGHVDVGGQVAWLMGLAAQIEVTTVDLRPFRHDLPTLHVREGTLERLPFEDRSLQSVSCLHVIEHVGLARYGDPLDPDGCWRALAELARVTAPGGTLLLAVPCGRPRVCFNAHRVFAPSDVLRFAEEQGLALRTLSGVTDARRFVERIDPVELAAQDYGCGFFEFVRPAA